ncbi:orotidine-5'-phosphate decarboxylase [Ascidiimonas aurantiaca]|uniref:orotidine-5'-phosphate decarboxylase n=1 Tax=Ascidiimonas aurantiaca TaxID=1685432 RepID=UPI0030EC4694
MTTKQLTEEILRKRSFLCIGLDVDINKLPVHLQEKEDPIFEFNKAIIEATHHLAVAYKPNTAFYEAYGVKGWESLQKTVEYINLKHPEIFIIADAKRGDIGNTSGMYARAFFEELQCDAVTVAPYMGKDSVEPFLAFHNRHTILLALTSNLGASDFQIDEEHSLYKKVIRTSREWTNSENLMYVVGATQANRLKEIRALIPESFLLVPGVGAQGGSLEEVAKYGMNEQVGLLVNSSRGIIYASSGTDFAQAAANKARELQILMDQILTVKLEK